MSAIDISGLPKTEYCKVPNGAIFTDVYWAKRGIKFQKVFGQDLIWIEPGLDTTSGTWNIHCDPSLDTSCVVIIDRSEEEIP